MTVKPRLNILLSYLIYLIPLLLLTGPFLPDLFVSLSALIFLFILLKDKEYKYLNNPFSILFFSFCLYLVINSLASDLPLFSLKSSLVYLRFGLFALAIWYLLDRKENFIQIFTIFLIVSFFIALFHGFYEFTYGKTILGKVSPSLRLSLISSDNQALGHWISRLFPLLIALLIYKYKPNKFYYLFIFFMFIGIDTLVYLSGERTSLGLMLLSSLFILLLMKNLRIFRLFTIFCSVGIIVFISFLYPSVKERNIDYTIAQLGLNEESKKINMFSPLHENYFTTAWNIYTNNKLIGIGPNNYRHFCNTSNYGNDKNSCSTHPHNNYLQIFAEIGIIGFLFIASILFYLLKIVLIHINSLIKNKDKEAYLSDYQVCLLACFLCSLWPLLPTLNFFNNWINIIYYLPIGFFLHSIYYEQKK